MKFPNSCFWAHKYLKEGNVNLLLIRCSMKSLLLENLALKESCRSKCLPSLGPCFSVVDSIRRPIKTQRLHSTSEYRILETAYSKGIRIFNWSWVFNYPIYWGIPQPIIDQPRSQCFRPGMSEPLATPRGRRLGYHSRAGLKPATSGFLRLHIAAIIAKLVGGLLQVYLRLNIFSVYNT